MTPTQKAICRELIRLSIENGFGCLYPLAPIAKKLKIKRKLYDNNTNTGILWDLGPHGAGVIYVSPDGKSASIDYDQHHMVANWCECPG